MTKRTYNWISAETRVQHINELPNIEFLRWLAPYKNNTSKAMVRCAVDGYEWPASVGRLISGRGCPQCGGVRKWTPDERMAQINKIENISFIRWAGAWRGARSRVIVKCCVDNYEWETDVHLLVNQGTGCPQCSGVRKWTAQERQKQIEELEGIEFINWPNGFKGNHSKALVKCCVDGFEWQASVTSLLNNGSGCAKCAGNYPWTEGERITQLQERGDIDFIRFIGAYVGTSSKVLVKCKKDGYEWASTAHGLLTSKSGCPMCSKHIPWTESERIAQINKLENIRFIRFRHGYRTSHSKATVLCTLHNLEWDATVNKLVNGGRGCYQCGGESRADKRRIPEEERISQINELDNIKFTRWENEYKSSNSKAVCQCTSCGHEWGASVSSLLNNGSGCPKCAPFGYDSCKPGTLYILRSECGSMVKIGISNNYEQRHNQLRRATPFDWHCIELLHSDDGSLIAEWEKELHSWTEQAEFREPFDGYTEWRKWDPRLPRWLKRFRARLARYHKAP